MYLKDIHHDTSWEVLIDGQAITTNTTTIGASVNVAESENYAFEFVVNSSTVIDGVYTLVLQDSPDDLVWTNVADEFLLDATDPVIFIVGDDNKIRSQGYNGHQPFVRPTLVSTGVTSGGGFGVSVLKQMHRHLPVDPQL